VWIEKEDAASWFSKVGSKLDVTNTPKLELNKKVLDRDGDYHITIEKNSTLGFLEKLVFEYDLQFTPTLEATLKINSELEIDDDINADNPQELAKISMFNVKTLTIDLEKGKANTLIKTRKI
jgi:hypothetical protein